MAKRKFAIFDYVKNKNEIELKWNFLKQMPDFIWNWYIQNFCPITIKKLNFDLADGFLIKLPIEKNKFNNFDANKIFMKVLKKFNDVKIIKYPNDFILDEKNKILVSHGNYFFAFVIMDAIKKFLPNHKKKLSESEILILDSNFYLTNIVLDNIYEHVNYLTVVTQQKNLYKKKEYEIFRDTGLNLQVLDYKKNLINESDIIININFDDNHFFNAIKKNVLYFDLSDSKKKYSDELKIKRPDIFVFDKLNLLYKNNLIDNKTFEMILHCADNDFKKIFDDGYDKKIFNAVKKSIQTLDIKISSFQK